MVGGLVVLGAYLLVLPVLWPEPVPVVDMPRAVTVGAPAEVSLTVRAWHPNVEVNHVSLVVESPELLPGPGGRLQTLFPFDVARAPSVRQVWRLLELNRLTWPRSWSFRFRLPLDEIAAAGLLRGDRLRGTVHVGLGYATVFERRACLWCRGHGVETVTSRTPFELVVHGEAGSGR